MNVIREISRLNDRELQLSVSASASWHAQYSHSAYVFIASLPFSLTEGDLLAVFSQFGEIVDLHLVRDHSTGASRGFAFLAYEDVRSCVLAIDNMNGYSLLGRQLRVDHADRYRRPKMFDHHDKAKQEEYALFDEVMGTDSAKEEYDQRRKMIWDEEAYNAYAALNSSNKRKGANRPATTSHAASAPQSTAAASASSLTANTAGSGVTSQIMSSVDLAAAQDPAAQRIAKLMERRRKERQQQQSNR